MNNSLFDIITGKDRKRYNQIIQLIEQKKYKELFEMDTYHKFDLKNQKYINKIFARMEQEISLNPIFLIQMNKSYYHRANEFNEKAIKSNPKIIEMLIEEKIPRLHSLIIIALESGYMPSDEYINNHISSFSSNEIMLKLINNGYKPTDEIIEQDAEVFSNEELLTKVLDLGYIPSLNFMEKTKLLSNKNLAERILNTIELTPEIINSSIFLGNAFAQQLIISKRPDLILNLNSNSEVFQQFWIEAIKNGYIPESALNNYHISGNFLLFSKIIKQRPELIKYSKVYDRKERVLLDQLALCMGYVPTINDVLNSEYVKGSTKLMQALIQRRPEAIKYVEMSGENITQNEFFDLARLALDNGYIPTLEDLENNPILANSFDILKFLIQDNPNVINMIRSATPNKEELLKIAIANGYNGDVPKIKSIDPYAYHVIFELFDTETAIMYRLEKGDKIVGSRRDNYSTNLYNYLIEKGYKTEEIIKFFCGNYDVMKVIISSKPEYITFVSSKLSRNEIDELGLLAIEKGYEPKFEDEIFRYGSEIVKLMVKKYPNYLEKVLAYQTFDKPAIPSDVWLEICKISTDSGFLPDIEKIGSGLYGTTDVYNSSYEIMKKVIPKKPSLIESCSVVDKQKYDELCRLAISCGYEVTDEYVLTHWGSKMCSNYDLMAKYIANHPNFLSEVEITNSDEMIKLIDIAINSGLQLNSLTQKQFLKIFLSVDETKWKDYLDSSIIESLQKAKELYVNNDEISNTVNPKFLSEDVTSNFTKAQVEILSCYPKLQEKILNLSPNSYKAKIIYELVNKYKDNLEWIPILEKALDNVNFPEYVNLLSSIDGKELSQEEKENLIYLLMTNNHLDISSLEELKNINSIRNNYIEMLIKRNTLGSLKTAYFEKTFGIDLSTAINLVNTYGKSLESNSFDNLDEKNKTLLILLENMKKIININDIDILKYYVENINPNFIVKPDLMVTYEAKLKYLFTQEFNKSFTKPNQEDKVISNIRDEQDLDIYLAAGYDGKKKCRMMITSIGAYTNMEEPDDYYASWNVNKIASHGCCCSYVGEKNLGTAEVKYCCLGFTDYELGSLQSSGPYDLFSMSDEDSYQISADYPSMFLLPDDVLEYTRHTHNETVWERRNISNDKMFKKQPSYIVYFVDNFEDRLNDQKAMKQWESVKKASSNFLVEVDGIKKTLPIMVVEREKIAKSQLGIIQLKLNEFKETLSPKLIKEIISDYESNYAGNRTFHPNISEKYFPKHEQLSNSVVGKIIEVIDTIYQTKPNVAVQCVYELEKAVRDEQEKYNNTQHGIGQSLPSFNIEEAMININRLKSSFKINMDSIFLMVNKCGENNRQFEKSDINNINQEVLDIQLSSSDIVSFMNDSGLLASIIMYENEIKNEKVNNKLKVHGQRHIKNVLLYSALIGKNIVENSHDLDLIMLSAKYHDIGRKTDAHEEHSKSSAKIAFEKLRDKCSSEDLSIISTIIEFHEIPRNLQNIDEIFNNIAKKNGILENQITKVRQMAEVLRDADALDRTRFINKARLNPNYLQYGISKQLIKFAASLQETYAIQDLKEFQCDDDILTLLQNYTPQEILRTIRHSNKGILQISNVKNFVKYWSDSILHMNTMIESNSSDIEGGVKHGK